MNINQMANDLKDVPQQKLIQYVQDPNSVVPQFLALAEIQRRKTLERGAGAGQPPQSTVAQDIMAQAAPQPMAPQQAQGLQAMQRPQGVAALPTGMGEQAFAGGGIVAFAKGDEVEDPYAALSFTEKLKRLREAEDEDTAPQSGLFKRGIPTFGNFQKNLESYAPAPTTSEQVKKAIPETTSGLKPDSLGRYVASSEPAAPSAPSAPKSRSSAGIPSTLQSAEKAAPKEDMYSKYEQMLLSQQADTKAARDQDKYLRLVEAGLGMMGGTSPYALTNIGQGSMGAIKGYAQDLAAARKEDANTVKELMGLGMKKEEAQREAQKLAMTEKLYGAHGRYYDAAAAAAGARASGAGSNAGMDKARLAAVTQRYNAWLRLNPMATAAEQQAKLTEIEGQVGMPGAQSGNIGPTVIPFSSLK